MTQRLTVASLFAAILVLACASVAFAQETKYPDTLDAKPMFKAGPNHMELAPNAPATSLVQWNGTFTDLTLKKVTYTMVRTKPSLIYAFDAKLQSYMTYFTQINPGVLPLFVTYDIFLTSGGCCIGGYHNANGVQPGGQTYAHATYVDSKGSFSQDVSALSHEIGEWMDDPFTDNFVHCTDNGLMEDGDPLEGNANFGAFPYTLGGFTSNFQSLRVT